MADTSVVDVMETRGRRVAGSAVTHEQSTRGAESVSRHPGKSIFHVARFAGCFVEGYIKG